MTATITEVDPALEQEIRDALDQAICDVRDCVAIATVKLIALPCKCWARLCDQHRAGIDRTFRFHARAGIGQSCGHCGAHVNAIRWEPL